MDDYSEDQNQRRTDALLSGRWGDAAGLRRRSRVWYEELGIPGDIAEGGRLHPVVEYVANCRYTGDPCLVEAAPYFKSLPTVPASTDRARSWAFADTQADLDLLTVIGGRRSLHVGEIRPLEPRLDEPLDEALELLAEVAPRLTEDALSFTRRHVFVKSERMVGRTWVDLGGLIVSGDPALESTAILGESLFHESLHSKFYTIERGMSEPTPDEEDSPTPVSIPWQIDSDGVAMRWTAERTLDAFYVYVHLGALRMAFLHHEPTELHIERMRRIAFRSAYLSQQLQTVCAGVLDDERNEIFRWLDACRVPAFDLNEEGQKLLLHV